jgi:NAD(P)-dependent dehydrogenase (short-subunit alcohol dehydrogenase family)
MSKDDMQGQVALVTGAASGIGRATSIGLAQQGVTVAMVDQNGQGLRETAATIKAGDGACKDFIFDLRDWKNIPALVNDILGVHKDVHILVNCAGTTDEGKTLLEVDAATWDEVHTVNLRSPFILMQHIARHMIARGSGGKIVNISSSSGFRAKGAPPTYSSSKAALVQLTRSAAAELAPHNINVNAIAPGVTNTAMMAAYPRDLCKEGPLANLFERWSEPEDVANVIQFLCSPQARQITGQVIHTSAGAIV